MIYIEAMSLVFGIHKHLDLALEEMPPSTN